MPVVIAPLAANLTVLWTFALSHVHASPTGASSAGRVAAAMASTAARVAGFTGAWGEGCCGSNNHLR